MIRHVLQNDKVRNLFGIFESVQQNGLLIVQIC